MIQISVAVPSGHSENFSLPQSSKVGDLRVLAQKSFQLGLLRLVAADHSLVDPTKSLQDAGLEAGDHLTAIAVEAQLAATDKAFALLCTGGHRVVTWGDPRSGGDSSRVQGQLKGVQQVQATSGAFAAILADGSVVTWGDPDYGRDLGLQSCHHHQMDRPKSQRTHLPGLQQMQDRLLEPAGHP